MKAENIIAAKMVPRNRRHMDLIKKIQTDSATESEREEFKKLHEKRSVEILRFFVRPARLA